MLLNTTGSRFKNEQGQRLLKALFFEQVGADKSTVVYSTKDNDHTYEGRTYPSLYRLYLACEDLTEYSFATKYLDGWEHWEILSNCTWMKPLVARWRKELQLLLKSKALFRLMNEAQSSSKNAFQANKFIVEKGYVDAEAKSKVGRPSKEEISRQAQLLHDADRASQEDLIRIGSVN